MKVFGLFGEKLTHSLSPSIHNAIYKALDIEATYNLFEIKPQLLQDAVKGVTALNISGVNVTIPYKLNVMAYLEEISSEANRIGAVNTIHNNNGHLVGYNTDYTGFGRMLSRSSINVNNKAAVVLGTGGASKAVITYLEDNAIAKIYLVSRNPHNVNSYDRSKYELIDYNELSNIKHADILINCTPCGMYPNVDCSPMEEKAILKFTTVVDLIYNPSETLLLKHARKYNVYSINGLYMLVAQAAAAVEIWTNQCISDNIVEDVYQSLLHYFD